MHATYSRRRPGHQAWHRRPATSVATPTADANLIALDPTHRFAGRKPILPKAPAGWPPGPARRRRTAHDAEQSFREPRHSDPLSAARHLHDAGERVALLLAGAPGPFPARSLLATRPDERDPDRAGQRRGPAGDPAAARPRGPRPRPVGGRDRLRRRARAARHPLPPRPRRAGLRGHATTAPTPPTTTPPAPGSVAGPAGPRARCWPTRSPAAPRPAHRRRRGAADGDERRDARRARARCATR